MIVKNDLFDYQNRFIYQESTGFKFSLDSILLAEFARTSNNSKIILDLCSGNCAVPLIMSCYNKAHYYAFEIQKNIFELGIKSIKINNLDNQISLINDDVNNIEKYFSNEFFDIITCNPPFFKVKDQRVVNPNINKALARHELSFHLEDAFKISSRYLKNNGILYIVQRSERLDELFVLANKYNINIKNIQLVTTKKGDKPSIVLVKCIKNSKMGIVINNEICIQNLSSYQHIFKEK